MRVLEMLRLIEANLSKIVEAAKVPKLSDDQIRKINEKLGKAMAAMGRSKMIDLKAAGLQNEYDQGVFGTYAMICTFGPAAGNPCMTRNQAEAWIMSVAKLARVGSADRDVRGKFAGASDTEVSMMMKDVDPRTGKPNEKGPPEWIKAVGPYDN